MARSEPADVGIARELLFYGRVGIETADPVDLSENFAKKRVLELLSRLRCV